MEVKKSIEAALDQEMQFLIFNNETPLIKEETTLEENNVSEDGFLFAIPRMVKLKLFLVKIDNNFDSFRLNEVCLFIFLIDYVI